MKIPNIAQKALTKILAQPIPLTHRRHYKIALYKLDAIGDMVLALTAVRRLVHHYGKENCLLVVNAQMVPLLERELQGVEIVPVKLCRDGTIPELIDGLLPYKWRISQIRVDTVICLRYLRHNYDNLHLALIPHGQSVGIDLSGSSLSGQHLPKKPLFSFNDSIPIEATTRTERPNESQLCQELYHHRLLLNSLLDNTVSREEILPAFSSFAASDSVNRLVITPFGTSPIRSYPESLLADSVARISSLFSGGITLAGTMSQHPGLSKIRATMLAKGVKNVTIETGLALCDFVELVAKSRAVLSVDTGTAHIATALDKPTVIIIGGGHHSIFGPWCKSNRQIWLTHELPCFGCHWICHRKEAHCITGIGPDEVAASIEQVLSE